MSKQDYYISSMEAQTMQFNMWIRSLWAIENNLHYTLDVVKINPEKEKDMLHRTLTP